MAASIAQVLQRHDLRHLALAGGLFANAALNRHLAETLPLAGLAVYPAAGGRGVAEGSVLQYLLERDGVAPWLTQRRSEEHTSELQSLMRISYAVFCLKKKTTSTHHL